MPASENGNILGKRGVYVYTDDKGNSYTYRTDEELAASVGATKATAAGNSMPKGFKPRGVHVELKTDQKQRKFIIVPVTTLAAWDNKSVNLTVAGKAAQTTGRRGESMSFMKLDEAAPPGP